ncbi:MAG: Ku protein [Alphaproteobacteria bacterium]
MAAKKTTPSSSARKKTTRSSSHAGRGIEGRRPSWSGNLRLALVSVPVKLYPATQGGQHISFHQIHEPSGKRIRYEKVVPGIGPVDTDDIVKGYELEKGKYILIDPHELEDIKLEARKTLDLVQFVGHCEIDPIWFDRPYYVVADNELAEEAYGILREALRSSERVGIGQFVMRGREYIGALKPSGQGMLLETLRFDDEVRSAAPYFSTLSDTRPDKELLDLAKELIERKSAAFDPTKFKDSYTAAVRELIDAKAKRKKVVRVDEEEGASGGANVIDLVEALKRSVSGAKSDKNRRSSSGGRQKKTG